MSCRAVVMGAGITVWSCSDIEESWISGMAAEQEAMLREYELECLYQWGLERGLHDEETDIEYIEVELLPEVQRQGVVL